MVVAMNEPLLPIGQFARRCRLSVKQLRHYDELGLLRPARVDQETGYRYYRAGQARQALSIGLLRSLDVPLADIGRVLSGAAADQVLGAVRERLEADLARRRQALAALDRVLAEGLPQVQVTLVREPPRRVVAVRETAPPEQVGRATSACVARLLEALAASGRRPTGPLVGLFPLDLTERLTVVVVAEADGEVAGATPDVLAGGSFASATHVGPYQQITVTAHGLLAWCGERGHTPTGPLREVYVSDPTQTPPEQLVTHLRIRLEDPE
jgi:DNA-binding transcriptional MerR regulator